MLKKGDIISVSYRRGYDKQGNPVMETYDKCIVEEIQGSHIKVSYRVVGQSDEGKEQVQVLTMSFNVNSPDFVSVTPLPKSS
jgi:hypothetical protein